MKINKLKKSSIFITVLTFTFTLFFANNAICQQNPCIENKEIDYQSIPDGLKGIIEKKLHVYQLKNKKKHEYRVLFFTYKKVCSINLKKTKKRGRTFTANFKVDYQQNSNSNKLYLVSFDFKINGKRFERFLKNRPRKRIVEIRFDSIYNIEKKNDRTGIATATNEVPDDPNKLNYK
ncbi:hypothetical protein Q4Q35_08900 [Flavivirga aquimarina]|uniref:Uncharacterized protein n=1 Tax=Flavivirga aquimarina TaxID=2027862 RepID=A0ABT8WA31_9FLAO|nr:hypothetical protein [Flavivirga aquimarina]MDO5969926.1 hypothetical protein [Flavivirga aquimarina]